VANVGVPLIPSNGCHVIPLKDGLLLAFEGFVLITCPMRPMHASRFIFQCGCGVPGLIGETNFDHEQNSIHPTSLAGHALAATRSQTSLPKLT